MKIRLMGLYVGTSAVKEAYLGGRLPSEYQEVEYIQSSGTQRINTGVTPSNTTKVELKMGGRTSTGSHGNLFGARYNWSASGRGFLLGDYAASGQYFGMFNQWYAPDHGGWTSSTFSFNDGGIHTIEMSQSGIYQDGILRASLTTTTFTSPGNMYIFCDNNNGSAAEYAAYKLYYFKMYTSGTLVRDFVPCYRKSDSVIGMYDTVNNQFYTNSGTGTFTKGPNV